MSKIYQQKPWSLEDLFDGHDGPAMQAAFQTLDSDVSAFEQCRPQLATDIPVDQFLKIVDDLEQINRQGARVYGFASLWFAADTQDQNAQAFMARVQQWMAGLENRTLFFSLWWKELDQEAAGRLMAASGDYRYWLEEMRHFKPHTLSEPEEKIINTKNTTGQQALHNLYDAITNRYVYKLTIDEEEKELTRGEVMVYARRHDPALRKRRGPRGLERLPVFIWRRNPRGSRPAHGRFSAIHRRSIGPDLPVPRPDLGRRLYPLVAALKAQSRVQGRGLRFHGPGFRRAFFDSLLKGERPGHSRPNHPVPLSGFGGDHHYQ